MSNLFGLRMLIASFKHISLVLLTACAILVAAACSDDTYIATNESLGGGGGPTGGAAGSGAGGNDGGGAGGVAGGGGSAGTPSGGSAGTTSGGTAGTTNTGGTTGTCTPGQKQDVGTCQKCGISRRTCAANGSWDPPVCEDQKECNPGDKTTSGCSDPCAEKTCDAACAFGACGKKTGASCLYNGGNEWQCCGTNKWQYCSSSTCDWFPCQDCPAASSTCLSKC